ncbi:MAG: Fe(2+)-trafficking protein [Planctomycetota bacterium]|nr:Fe(2+)-trafficking protein [Planctomycetota bacterium]
MADSSARIEQFRKMAEADPGNELGHFSLGKAYFDAGMMAPAITSFERVIELNPAIAKVYQLLGSALLKENRGEDAINRLTQGVEVAAARGDMMPKDEMVRMLKELGAPIPASATTVTQQPVSEGELLCNRCGKVGKKMLHPPFSNAQGKEIQSKICANCWREWIGMGTKVINELRLPLSDPQAQKIFDQHMKEFLNL